MQLGNTNSTVCRDTATGPTAAPAPTRPPSSATTISRGASLKFSDGGIDSSGGTTYLARADEAVARGRELV